MSDQHDPFGSQNGSTATPEREVVAEKLDEFVRAGRGGTSPPQPPPSGDDDSPPSEARPVGLERHPEDPPEALKAAAGEAALLDPDEMRERAIGVGQALQAVPRETFRRLLRDFYFAIERIRRGAVEGPALEEAGRLAAEEAATEREVDELQAEGLAAADELAHRENTVLPRLETEEAEAKEELVAAVKDRDDADQAAIDDPTEFERVATADPTPVGGAFHWVKLAAKYGKEVLALEVVLGGMILSGQIGKVASFDFPFANVLVASALSLILAFLGFYAGKALAAVGSPVRLVAALFVVSAGWIVVKTGTAIDAIRVGESEDGKTVFTAATLSNIWIAALIGYAESIRELFARRRTLIEAAPMAADLRRLQRERREARIEEGRNALAAARAAVVEERERVEKLRTFVAGTDARCRAREAAGVVAGVAFETERARLTVHCDQEKANRDAAIAVADMAGEKMVAEAYPEPEIAAAAIPSEVGTATMDGGLNRLHKAAIVCLLIGALGGLLDVQLVLTLGAAAAAILLLLGLSEGGRRRLRPLGALTPSEPPLVPEPVAASPGIAGERGWKVPPRTTRPKYGPAGGEAADRL